MVFYILTFPFLVMFLAMVRGLEHLFRKRRAERYEAWILKKLRAYAETCQAEISITRAAPHAADLINLKATPP